MSPSVMYDVLSSAALRDIWTGSWQARLDGMSALPLVRLQP